MKSAPILLALAPLTACVAPVAERETTNSIPAKEAGGFECDAASVQYALGQKTSVALAQKLLKEAGATILRWIPPRSAVTMDYSPVRLNIGYNDDMVIDRITCG
jgi:Peptidase inhibitor I78 family